MKAEEFLKNLLSLDSNIRFCGIVERSGHLHSGVMREGLAEHLKGRNPEISYAQSAYIIDLRKIFASELGELESIIYIYQKVIMISSPLKDQVLLVSSDISNLGALLEKIRKYIEEFQNDLELNAIPIISEEKKEMVRNLYDSGISEDLISEQLDLDLKVVKNLVGNLD